MEFLVAAEDLLRRRGERDQSLEQRGLARSVLAQDDRPVIGDALRIRELQRLILPEATKILEAQLEEIVPRNILGLIGRVRYLAHQAAPGRPASTAAQRSCFLHATSNLRSVMVWIVRKAHLLPAPRPPS